MSRNPALLGRIKIPEHFLKFTINSFISGELRYQNGFSIHGNIRIEKWIIIFC